MLENSDVEKYHQQGFCVLRAMVETDVLNRIRDDVSAAFRRFESDRDNLRVQFRRRIDNDELVVDRVDPIIDQSAALESVARGVFQATATQLLGVTATLFKDKLVWKSGGTRGYELHQDFTFWSDLGPPANQMLSICLALDASTAENGCLKIYPGRHHQHLLRTQVPSNIFSSGSGVVCMEHLGSARACHAELYPGDIVAFSSLAPHESDPNTTNGLRRQLFFSYCPASYADAYHRYYQLFHTYLRRDRGDGETIYFQ